MSTTAHPPKPKRRWCRFSLKTLLIASVALTVGLGWVALRVKRAQANRDRVTTLEQPTRHAVRELEKADVYLRYKFDDGRPPTFLEQLFDDPGTADDPVQALTVWTVHFGSRHSDADLQHLKQLADLEVLFIEGRNFTDAGLVHLKELLQLEELWLDCPGITNAGMVHLEGLTNLKVLDMLFTAVTYPDGVKNLQKSLPNCSIRY